MVKWKQNGFKTSGQTAVRNKELWLRLDELVRSLQTLRIEVMFKHVPRSQNATADALANKVLDAWTPFESVRDPNCWIVSKMTDRHRCNCREKFGTYTAIIPLPIEQQWAKTNLWAAGIGSITLNCQLLEGRNCVKTLHGVLHVPGAPRSLFSPFGHRWDFKSSILHEQDGETSLWAPRRPSLYVVQLVGGPCSTLLPDIRGEEKPKQVLVASAWAVGEPILLSLEEYRKPPQIPGPERPVFDVLSQTICMVRGIPKVIVSAAQLLEKQVDITLEELLTMASTVEKGG